MSPTRPARPALLGRLRSGLLATGTVVALATAGIALTPVVARAATALTVTTTVDADPATIAACTTPSVTDPATATISFREAVCVADNRGGTQSIDLPGGTYSLQYGSLPVGTTSGSDITIAGAGAAGTVVDAGQRSRILELDLDQTGGVAVTVSGVTLQNGLPDAGSPTGSLGGGAILAGADATPLDSLTVSDARFVGNTAATGTATNAPGGAIQMTGGSLSVTGTTFDQNTAGESPGGAIAFLGGGSAGETLTIANSTFTANTVTNDTSSGATNAGGAVFVRQAAGGSSIDRSTFTQNTATGVGATQGGAVALDSGSLAVTRSVFATNSASSTGADGSGGAISTSGALTATFDRFTGNTASAGGSAITQTGGTATANDDWWGCNTGPGTGCQTVSGTVATTSWLRFTASASPAAVTGPNGQSAITATFATDSAGATIAAADLGAFAGLDVAFAVDAGGDSFAGGSTTTTITSNAAGATATYDSGSAGGARNVRAAVFGVTAAAVVTVQSAPAITSPANASFTVGQAGSFTVTSTGSPTATISETGALPAGLTFTAGSDGTATIAGTPTQGGTFPVTIRADNGTGTAATQDLVIAVTGAPQFTSPATTTFRAGTAGSFTVTTTGSPTPAITRTGTLPSGLSFVDDGDGTATLAGTVAAGQAGTYTVDLTATNGVSPNAVQTLTIQVTAPSAVTTDPAAQTVRPGDSVSFTASASGSPTPSVQWQRSTDGGATFTDLPGATATTYTFTAAASDDGSRYRAVFTNSTGTATTTAAVLRVGDAPVFTSADAATVVAGRSLSVPVTTSGTPSASLSASGLPSWLTLTDAGDGTGTLSGTAPVGAAGTTSITLRAANGFTPDASQTFTLTVDAPPTITSADATTFVAGTAGSFTVRATSGYPTATALTVAGALPAGVTFVDQGDGTATLAGTPATGTGGTYPLTIRATATGGTAPASEQSFVLTVDESAVVTSPATADFRVGVAGTAAVTTRPGVPSATTVSVVGTLPAGLVFTADGGSGTISGTPAAGTAGVTTVTVVAHNEGAADDTTQILTIRVADVPAITSTDTATFAVGGAGTFTITTTPGYPTATAIGTDTVLPAWLTLTDRGDGTATLTGTPTAADAGTVELDVRATNGTGSSPVQHLTLTVTNAPVIAPEGTTTFAPGVPVSVTIGTGNAVPVPTLSLDTVGGPFLPEGLTFTDDGDGTATISGTPTGPSITDLVVVADNGVDGPVRATVTLTIQGGPTITSAPTATFQVGAAGSFAVTATNGVPTATTLRVLGTLPDGLRFAQTTAPTVRSGLVRAAAAFDPGTTSGTISGTPTTAGTYRFSVTADNGVGDPSVQEFVLTVDPAAVTPGGTPVNGGPSDGGVGGATGTGPTGVTGTSGTTGLSGRLAFTGGTLPWDLAAGALALVLAGLVLTLRRRRDRA